jgi:TPR repeat protein
VTKQKTRVSAAELQLAQARSTLANQQALVKRTEEYVKDLKAEVAKLEAQGTPGSATKLNRLYNMVSLYTNNVTIYANDLKKFEQFEIAAQAKVASAQKDLAALAAEEKALIASLTSGKATTIPQGDSAKADEVVTTPAAVQTASTRPATMTTVGQTGTEQNISQQNDVKVGVGNDTQQIYNSINSVTQPTSTGLPTLKKL